MLAPTMMSRYSVGKSDVWISGTLALALRERIQKNGKKRNLPLLGVSLAILLFFYQTNRCFLVKSTFYANFGFKMEN